MKKSIFITLILLIIISCNKKSKTEQEIEKTPVVKLQMERFDKDFFETPVANLPKLKKQYPSFFPPEVQDSVWTNKMANPLWRELYKDVQAKYSNFEPIKTDLEKMLQHMKYYFPKTKTPKIITLIYEMDYHTKAIYTDSLLIISLEMYLGKKHKFYEEPDYIKQNFEQNQILPDVVSAFYKSKAPLSKDKTLLSMMVDAGKELYIKDLLIPNYTDANKIGYTPEQIKWCNENEGYMWSYFIEKNLLYSNEPKLDNRFINLAPFSKFYLEIDNETPGRVGTWVGWQIVRSYMKNNNTPLQLMLMMSAEEIFNKSKYKPKKNE